MIYPKNIEKNNSLGVTATSMGITSNFDKKRFFKAIENIEKLGFKTIYTDNVFKNFKFVSGDGSTRAKEFMNLWMRDDVQVISQLRGGEFLLDILPYLDSDVIKNNNPKWVFGYSDSSLLNFYITTKFNIATINYSNILHFSMNSLHESLLNVFNCMESDVIIQKSFKKYEKTKNKKRLNYNLDGNVRYKSLYKEKEVTISGRLLGGCLEAITEIIGTKYDFVEEFSKSNLDGILWYLDIYDSNPLELYRKLWQMKEANWFSNINGIIIGRTKSIKKILDFTYLDSLHKIFDDMNIPVIYDVDIGHVMPQFSIINGSFGTFIYKNNKGILKQEKI